MPRAERPLFISADLKTFFESGLSVAVGTCNAGLAPEIIRAWGPRVGRDGRSVSLCVAASASARTLRNLEDNGRIAVTFALPTNYKAIQAWGRFRATGPPNRQDLAAIEAHREAFTRLNEGIGVPRRIAESFWQQELRDSPAMVRICFEVERFFDQTLGPQAGLPL